MNRHKLRIFLMETIYQHRLLNNDLKESFLENVQEKEVEEDEMNAFAYPIIADLEEKELAYIEEISMHLKRWSFSRLNLVDQAILLLSVSEMKLGLNDKAVIINEAIQLSKKYSDEESYRYINGVLDCL